MSARGRERLSGLTTWLAAVVTGITGVTVVTFFTAGRASAAEPPLSVQGPLAVLAIVEDEKDPATKMAKQVQGVLSKHKRLQVLKAAKLTQQLGGSSYAGHADEDLARLQALFKKGRTETYYLHYKRGIRTLRQVVAALERTPVTPERFKLFVDAHVFAGQALGWIDKKDAAVATYYQVLRTRPTKELSLREHSPDTIAIWEMAKHKLARLPRGELMIAGEPTGAAVVLDGVKMGTLPYHGKHPHGRYHLYVHHPSTGGASRWVTLGEKPVKIGMPLQFETALRLGREHPALCLNPQGEIPRHWWSWLSTKTDVDYLVVVRRPVVDKHPRWVASLVDMKTFRMLREGWLEPSGELLEHMLVDAVDLAHFAVADKQTSKRVVQSKPSRVADGASKASMLQAGKGASAPPGLTATAVRKRPLWRTWWSWALGSGALLVAGVITHAFAVNQDDSGLKSEGSTAKVLLGLAITEYALAAAAAVTGAMLHWTYDEGPTVVPVAGPDHVGLSLMCTF